MRFPVFYNKNVLTLYKNITNYPVTAIITKLCQFVFRMFLCAELYVVFLYHFNLFDFT